MVEKNFYMGAVLFQSQKQPFDTNSTVILNIEMQVYATNSAETRDGGRWPVGGQVVSSRNCKFMNLRCKFMNLQMMIL